MPGSIPTVQDLLEAAHREAGGTVGHEVEEDLGADKISKVAAALRQTSGDLIKLAAYWEPELGGDPVSKIEGQGWVGKPSQTDGVDDAKKMLALGQSQEARRVANFKSNAPGTANLKPPPKQEVGLSLDAVKSRLSSLGVPGDGTSHQKLRTYGDKHSKGSK